MWSLPDDRVCDVPLVAGASVARRPLVMGVINVTPDSFYDGGRWADPAVALRHGLDLVAQGADIVDVGGESTRPGADSVSADEQLRRVIPVIEGLRIETDRVISVDTSDATVAARALAAGATWLNDVTGLRGDARMAEVAAAAGAAVVCMHMLGTPRTMQQDPRYGDVVAAIAAFFHERLAWLGTQGVRRERVILDPGIGFGKTVDHNLEILRRVEEFHALGRPLLVGHSRKSFIGTVLGRETDDRLVGSLATVVSLCYHGVQIIRAHDVAATCQAIRMFEAIEMRTEGE